MAVQKEEELYQPIKTFYEKKGYIVKSEVMHCDIVAVKENETIIVELKKTFNLALLLQGVERLRLTDKVVLAVERNRKKSGAHNQRFSDLAELCRMLGIGLMTVTLFKTKPALVEMLCEPGELPVRHARVKQKAKLLREFRERSGDYNVGGSNGRKLVTAYREKSLKLALLIREEGPVSPSQAARATGNARCGEFLRNNYYGWFERISRGQYGLRKEGEAALIEYASVIENWKR
ncbi:DUF2161 family putative PD-(D/E)XK-type phosphodiesterase [Paenibacillus protaetiae]|uniref:Uncharacterized protein n=1 Tax=Paenibacillus protaetiae TaxID=2509456 RepID=A0A4P6EQC2_9BACL|nr:DUF2161 family putative PD-(D/E)XK-type phosphodiesterase [Paenibacillus protaetiae]QAY65024.1 hypothetical protein ET464_00100 [Paenibacillus protaetiae]